MLVISVELWPHGNRERKVELGRAEIWNDITGTSARGNYRYEIVHKGRAFRKGSILHFPRKRLNAFDLLCRVLIDCLGQRNLEEAS